MVSSPQHFAGCLYASDQRDGWNRPLATLAFTVDGMAGELRFTHAPPHGRPITAALLLHEGEGGTDWVDGGRRAFWQTVERDFGVRIISIKWQDGVDASVQGLFKLGWVSRTDERPSTFEALTRRPASVIQWAHEHLVPPGAKLGTVGCSGGAVATFSAVLWHGLDEALDYQLFSSGPGVVWDLNETCGARRPVRGVCEHNPAVSCRADTDCGAPANRCAFPARFARPVRLVDYVFHTTDCESARFNARFRTGGYRAQGRTRWRVNHPLDFEIGEGAEPPGDTEIGVTYAAGQTYVNVLSPTKRWIDNESATHCAILTDPAFQPQLTEMLQQGLGLTHRTIGQ